MATAATFGGPLPRHYRKHKRLLLAHEMLKRGDVWVGVVAREVGYESDAAFSRAFKPQLGVAPLG